jgi:aerobic carbon-monoxide dehydrogenase medium subunit
VAGRGERAVVVGHLVVGDAAVDGEPPPGLRFAMAAVGGTVRVSRGRVTAARIGLANAADVPVRAVDAEALLTGSDGSAEAVRAAADAAAHAADPADEPHCSAGYRRHVLAVLVRRALTEALDGATDPDGREDPAWT